MKARCDNPNATGYANYGGRGISYCKSWVHFENFAVDMGFKPTPDHTLERVDVDGDYCPSNCIWATRSQQCMNRRELSNNTTGATGVKRASGGRFKAVFDRGGVRYHIGGTFTSIESAEHRRKEVIGLFDVNPKLALTMCERSARSDSTTGVKGVSRHADGRGFTARVTTEAGGRKYLGYFKSILDAKHAIEHFKATNELLERDNKTWKQKKKN